MTHINQKSRQACKYSLCHTPEAPLHDKGRDLILHLSGFLIFHWCLGKNSEYFCQASIAEAKG